MTDNEIIKACKNCLHYEACKGTYYSAKGDEDILHDFDGEMYANSGCEDFEDKDHINRQKANAEGLTNAVKFLNEQLSSAKAETAEKTRALFQAMVNKFMSIKDLYVIVDGEYLPWEPAEEVEHLFGMSISGDNDECDKETDRVVKELVGDDNG